MLIRVDEQIHLTMFQVLARLKEAGTQMAPVISA